jgi:putative flippase GtrA
MIRQFLSRQFAVFLLTGGTAATVNFLTRILYNEAMPFSIAVVCSYVTGMVTAFVLNRMFVFRGSSQPVHHAAGYFVLVNLVAIAQTWAVSVAMLHYVLPYFGITRYAPELAHAAGIVVPVFTSFLGHKHFSFR